VNKNSEDIEKTLSSDSHSGVYVNEHGQLELKKLNDTTWSTSFMNNDGLVFDTVMYVRADSLKKIYYAQNEDFFLSYHWGGLSVSKDRITVFEFSSYGMLGAQTQMWGMYERPFYKLGTNTSVFGKLNHGKGGTTLDGIYLKDDLSALPNYLELTGTLSKEPYPIDYYSTTASPQGMFSDTTIKHYRLTLQNAKSTRYYSLVYKGYPVNYTDGSAAIAWEFADSEAYLLDGKNAWSEAELAREVFISGYLINDVHKGSVLYNWKDVTSDYISIESEGKMRIKGKTSNNHEGKASIKWEKVIPEDLILADHEPWSSSELDKEIIVEGKLVNDSTGMRILDWKVLN
jgi:hypothetical protein